MYETLRNIIIEAPVKHIGSNDQIITKTTLEELYKNGWWITEIFGSYANMVKISSCSTRKSKKPYFMCVSLLVDTKQITPKAYRLIEKIKKQQWKKYENLLKSKYG